MPISKGAMEAPFIKLLFSRKEAAQSLALSTRTIDHLIAAEKLKVRRMGGRVLIPFRELQRFAARDYNDALVPQMGGAPA